jgi:hypothetical protein
VRFDLIALYGIPVFRQRKIPEDLSAARNVNMSECALNQSSLQMILLIIGFQVRALVRPPSFFNDLAEFAAAIPTSYYLVILSIGLQICSLAGFQLCPLARRILAVALAPKELVGVADRRKSQCRTNRRCPEAQHS